MGENTIRLCLFAIIALFAAAPFSRAAEGDTAEQAIQKQVAKINEAWRSGNGAEIMRDVLSEAFTTSLPNPQNPTAWRTLNREQFCAAFSVMLKQNPPKEHVRETKKITVKGGVAYEAGVSIHVNKEGVRTEDEILNIWRKEGEVWRLFFSAKTQDLRESI